MNSLICSSPGRICLFGDHMDWCSRQVITAAVDMRIFLEGHRESTDTIEVHSFPPFLTHDQFTLSSIDPDMNSDLRYARGVMAAMKKKHPPVHLERHTTTLPPRRSHLNNNRRKPILQRPARKQRVLLLRRHERHRSRSNRHPPQIPKPPR